MKKLSGCSSKEWPFDFESYLFVFGNISNLMGYNEDINNIIVYKDSVGCLVSHKASICIREACLIEFGKLFSLAIIVFRISRIIPTWNRSYLWKTSGKYFLTGLLITLAIWSFNEIIMLLKTRSYADNIPINLNKTLTST